MKISLNCLERVRALELIPKEHNFVTMRMIKYLVDNKLGFSAEEIKEYSLEVKDGKISWNEEGGKGKEIDFAEKEIDLLGEQLKKLNEEKKITPELLSLYDKFVELKG